MDRTLSPFWGLFIFFLLFSAAKAEDENVIKALATFMGKLAPGDVQNDPNWGWNASDPCISKWKGVTCDKQKKNVKKIVLERLNLSGTVDFESLCSVSNLLVLSLNYNNLIGTLSDQISNCKTLGHLYLSGNRFSGDLPDSLKDLSSLKRIDISNNYFSGKLPDMSIITGLLSFMAQNNHLTGLLPNFNYRQLEGFSVANNSFSGPVPDDTGRFGANSFAENPQLCGKVLPKACPIEKEKKKKSKLNNFLIYSGYVILGLIVVVLIALLTMKKKKKPENVSIESSVKKGVKKSEDSGNSSESKNGVTRSEFSITSAESAGVSTSLVILSSPEVNGLKFEDLLRAPAELIGKGKHGSLYKVVLDGNVTLVVKRINDWEISRNGFKKRMQRIDQVKHPKVLPIAAYYCSKQEKLLVYEYQQNGSLYRLLHGSQNGQMFDWGSRLSIASSIADALAFMHEELQNDGIAHGNLKSSNILLNKDMEPIISEYGLMAMGNQTNSSLVNQTNSSQNKSVFNDDIYAFGVILLELLTGKTTGFNLAKWVNSVVRQEWTGEVFDKALIVEGASEERMVGLLQVALKCINASPELRPGIGQVAMMINSLKEEEDRSMTSSDP